MKIALAAVRARGGQDQPIMKEGAMRSVQRKNLTIAVSVFMLLFAVTVLAPARCACAAEVKGAVQLNAGITLADNLAALTGKAVTIHLTGGQSMTGSVKEVKNGLLHLEKISQKEFSDSLISIDTIAAIETRVR
jgi:hypothetical protein